VEGRNLKNNCGHGDRAKVEVLYPMRAPGDSALAPTPGPCAEAGRASGSHLLSSECMLEYSLRALVHDAPGGARPSMWQASPLPGAPGLIVGTQPAYALASPPIYNSTSRTLYLEEDATTAPAAYTYSAPGEQARAEREIIRVKGAPPMSK